ncbi:MAG: Fur family transcriptional regulator [Bacteroidales bacterium]
MKQDNILEIFSDLGIRATTPRILIYEYIKQQSDTFSLGDIENALPDTDKSTIFRTLILFEEHHLIHSMEDGSGAMKYCLCRNQGECEEEEFHCHFYCEKCKKTYCLDNQASTNITLPKGFIMNHINFIIKGICDKCSHKTDI